MVVARAPHFGVGSHGVTTYEAIDEFTFAGRKYQRGDAFRHELPAVEIVGLVRAQLIKKVAAPADVEKPSAVPVVNVSTSESTNVRTPKQRKQQRRAE